MKKLVIFFVGTFILSLPSYFLFASESISCKLLALFMILVIVFSGPEGDRKFWKEYFKIILPLPKEYDK